MNTWRQTYTAFTGHSKLAQGVLDHVVLEFKQHVELYPEASVLVFNDLTGKQMDFDLRGSTAEVLERLRVYLPHEEATVASTGPGRPKLGVVSREISLLPHHWEWLATQSGGASATLRRLIEEAKKSSSAKDRIKRAQERAYKFMAAIAGDFPHYEEALRALFAHDSNGFIQWISTWPDDIRAHAQMLAECPD